MLFAGTATLVGSTGAWWVVAAAAAVFALLVGLRMLWRKGRAHDLLTAVQRRSGVLAVFGILLLSVFVDTP